MTRASVIFCILFGTSFISHCSCDIENINILKCYEEYFNKENSNFTYEDGILYNKEQIDTSRYKIEITIKVKDQANAKSFRLLKCTATLKDDAGSLSVVENQCDDGTSGGRTTNEAADVSSELEYTQDYSQDETTETLTTETNDGRQVVNLDSEVQSDNAQINSSGEQFVAIPRPQPSTPCIGCSSLVDTNAPGVEGLTNLAIRHLNKHMPLFTHKLESILQIERQVQIVNGVRYILTIDVSVPNCKDTGAGDCSDVKTCKVSILEKPWLKLPNGKKFRAVLSNNCTEQWQFGDDGEALLTKDDDVINADDELIKVIKNVDVQGMPNSKRKLTEEELKDLEEQIIPTNEIIRQKRNAKNKAGVEVVLEPKTVYLLDYAIEAFEKYSVNKGLRYHVIYATRQKSDDGEITRIDFNVRVLEPIAGDKTNEVNMRCHTRVSETKKQIKSFYTFCRHLEKDYNGIIEMPASNPKFRRVAQAILHNDYGQLLQFYEVIRVYVNSHPKARENIIFDAKSSVNNTYRCYSNFQENSNAPLVCKMLEKEHTNFPKIEKDATAIEYLHLATVALKKYLNDRSITEPYIVAVVTHAAEAFALMTYVEIDFIAVDFDKTLRCISQIREKGVLFNEKVNVNCSVIPERKDYPAGVLIERSPFNPKYVKIAKEALEKEYPYLGSRDLRVVYVNEQLLDTFITRMDIELSNENTADFRCHVKLSQKASEKTGVSYIDCFSKNENVFGARHELNASDPKNWESAKKALGIKYNNSLVLLDVVRVTNAIVAGIVTKSDFYALSNINKIVHICNSQLYKSLNNVSELNVSCEPKYKKPSIVGRIEEKDPSNPKYKAIALEALAKKYQTMANESLQIIYANEQLVSGMITRFDFDIKSYDMASSFRCHVKLFEKAWAGIRDLYVDCFRSHEAMPGGLIDHIASDPKNWETAKVSLIKKYKYSMALLDVVRVTTQTSSGLTTETDFYAESNTDKIVHICHTKLYKPLNDVSEVTVDCEPKNKPDIFGRIEEKDPSNPKYKAIALEALAKKYQLVSVESLQVIYANEQLVSGLLTRFDFDIESVDNAALLRCHVKLLEEPWKDVRDLYVDCFHKSRAMPGSWHEHNASDPKNWKHSEEALLKQNNHSLALLDVVRVSTAVAAGLLTKTEFYAVSHVDKRIHKCQSYKLEQSWKNFTEINIECKPQNVKPVPGKVTEKDPRNPELQAVARMALKKQYPELKSNNITVIYANEQFLNGMITRLDFDVFPNNAPKASQLRCHVKLFGLLNEKKQNFTVNCFVKSTDGSTEQNASDPRNWHDAEESLAKQYGSSLSLLDVIRVTTRSAHGGINDTDFDALSLPNHVVYRCHSTVFKHLWGNLRDTEVWCEPILLKLLVYKPDKIVKKYPSDPKFMELANKSLSQFLTSINSNKPYRVVQVTQASEHIGEGLSTDIQFIAVLENDMDILTCFSNIREKSWLNSTVITVDCNSVKPKLRSKRESGNKYEQDPTNPLYMRLAEKSLKQYLSDDKSETDYKIKIDKVTTRISAGVHTEIDFTATSVQNSDGYKCHALISEKYFITTMVVDVECDLMGRKKRHNVLGGKTEQDPNDPKYVALAKKSLSQYLNNEGTMNTHQISVDRVTTQVVAGVSIDILFTAKSLENSEGYKCDANIWERPWLNSSVIKVNCSPLKPLSRKKRQITGGKTEQDPNDPKYVALAKKSLSQYLNNEGTMNTHQISVDRVTTQVVAGVSIDILFTAKSLENSEGYKCDANIWERPWLNSSVIKVNCSPLKPLSRKKRGTVVGGETEQDPDDPKYMSMAKKSLSQYLYVEGAINKHRISVDRVTTQQVSGIFTRIYFTAVEKHHYRGLKCISKIYDDLYSRREIDVDCKPLHREERSVNDVVPSEEDAIKENLGELNPRLRRSIDLIKRKKNNHLKSSSRNAKDESDYWESSINNEDMIKADHFANEALKYIEAKYRHPRQMKVISIFSFNKDPTSAHYRIKIEVGYTDCLALAPIVGSCSLVTDMGANKYCRVSVWLQPKRDHPPRFKVSCDIDESVIEINKNTQAEHLFFDFLTTYKPSYLNNFTEMSRRLKIFKQNIERIHELNTHERGTARYAVTKFSDLSDDEFSAKYLGLKPHLASSSSIKMNEAKIPKVALPASFDWREKGAVTEVKNQGQCGSCWAFSVTGNIEGQWKIKSGQLVSLSEQELVDCDKLDQGCNGGLPDNAYRAIEQLGGLETEQEYPYEASNDKCVYNQSLSKVQISGAVNITSNETSMAMWMVEHGPISIGINANAMQFYVGGVSHPWKALCNPKNLDHGVLIVGFGIKEYPLFHKSLPYWIVKNSWGTSWGEQGYYRIYRGDGSCGVNQMASSAIV